MPTDTNTYIFVDTSGSTGFSGNKAFYWTEVERLLSKYDDDPYAKFFEWNNNCRAVEHRNRLATCNSGTNVVSVAKTIVGQNLIDGKILLVTDGEVGHEQLQLVNQVLREVDLLTECYLINVDRGSVNMSVPTHFTRLTGSKVELLTTQERTSVFENNTDYDDYTDDKISQLTLDDSRRVFEEVRALVLAKNLGRSGSTELRDIVLKVKRHFTNLSTKQVKHNPQNMKEAILGKNFEKVDELISQLIRDYHTETRSSEEKKYQQLLNWCGNTVGMTSLDAIKFKTSSAPVTEQVHDIEEVQEETGVDCPITFDDLGQGCLPILEPSEHIFAQIPNSKISDVLSMPLNMLHLENSSIPRSLVNCVGRLVGQLTAIQMRGQNDPFTRRPIVGYIPLGCTKNAIDVGNATLSRLLSVNGKQPGNFSFILSSIFLALKRNQPEWMEDSTLELLKKHLQYRFENCESWMSLNGLPDYLRMRAPMIVCLYYVCNYHLFKGVMHDAKNIFSYYANQEGIMEDLFELADTVGLEITEESWKNLKWMQLHRSMRLHAEKNVPLLIRALFRGSLMLEEKKIESGIVVPPLVITDAPLDEEQVNRVKDMLPKVMQEYDRETLLSVLKQHKNLVDLHLEECDRWPQYTKYTSNGKVNISPLTLRPYYYVRDKAQSVTDKTWMTSYMEKFGDKGEIFSGAKLMMEYMVRYEQLPLRDEYIAYAFTSDCNKHCARMGIQKTYGVKYIGGEVPRHIGAMYETLVKGFKEALEEVGSETEAVRRYTTSAPIETRCAMESGQSNNSGEMNF
uniref:Uncharacterized protein n=1 Tax=Percolomonas cosmopolitus TaxID=63605 RepID=A0A7S1KRN0_9EUKA